MIFLASKAATWNVLFTWCLAEIRQEGMENKDCCGFLFYFFSSQQDITKPGLLFFFIV